MSDSNEFTTSDGSNTQDPGSLRKLLEQKIAELKAVTAENEALKSKETERALVATWSELQVPDAIRKLYQGEKTADAIKAWWEDSKGLFNIEAAVEQKPTETPEQQELAQQIQAAQQAATLGNDATSGGYSAAFAKAQEIKGKSGPVSSADLDAFFRTAGIPQF